MNRRDFLRTIGGTFAYLGISACVSEKALRNLELNGKPEVIWLAGQACSGCSVSLTYAKHPSLIDIILDTIQLSSHPNLSTAQGKVMMDNIYRRIEKRKYIFVLEGAVPEKIPEACMLDGKPIAELVEQAARNSLLSIAIGACATFGGVVRTGRNPTGAVGLRAFLKKRNINKDYINISGCPVHYDWFVRTLIHYIAGENLKLDEHNRPVYFYNPNNLLHTHCDRSGYYAQGKFSKDFSEPYCYNKLGCKGPKTNADCSLRYWNDKTSWCVDGHSPCIGCVNPDFPETLYKKTV